jgi:hypothetical protein
MTQGFIHITAVPEGDAPQWVREKWVGLELPLVLRQKQSKRFFTKSVLMAPNGFFKSLFRILTGKSERKEGFVVRTMDAIAELEKASPEAAAWWRENTPYLLKPKQYFIFKSDCCYLVEDRKTV